MKDNGIKRIGLCAIYLAILGICIQFAGSIIVDCILNASSSVVSAEYTQIVDALTDINSRVIIYTVIFAPIIEEVMFRGGLIWLPIKLFNDAAYGKKEGNYVSSYKLPPPSQKEVEKKKKFADNIDRYRNYLFFAMLTISSLIFGVYHGNIVQGTYAFIIGLILGIIAYKKTLFASIWLHMVINLTGIIINHVITNPLGTLVKGTVAAAGLIIGGLCFYRLVFALGKDKCQAD